MGILMWEKPEQVMTKEQWSSLGADGAPPGCYVSNMSQSDRMRWKAKLVGHTLGFPQVEIRRDSTVIVVSLKGYKYNNYDTRQNEKNQKNWEEVAASKYSFALPVDEQKYCVHIATAGALQLTLDKFIEFQTAINEAFEVLYVIEKNLSSSENAM